MDRLGSNNLTKVIMAILMKCRRLTKEEVAKKLLCFGANGAFVFQRGNRCHKVNKGCLGTLFNGCPLCGSLN